MGASPIPAALETASAPSLPALPLSAEICGYPIDSVLNSSQSDEADFMGPSYLAIGPGGRGIVLKPLETDCLLKNRLHPSIKERLSRVRELALAGVANLYGVERDAAGGGESSPPGAWLIWEYVQGRSLDGYSADAGCAPRKLALVARELVLTVESLHRQGIVHGAIRATNIIVDAHGAVRLTHVSPLLYSDPGDDVWGILHTLLEIVRLRGEEKTPLGRVLSDVDASLSADGPAPASEAVLRLLATRLAGVIDARDRVELMPTAAAEPDAAPRRRSLFAAFAALVLGAGIAFGVWKLINEPDLPLAKWLQSLKESF